MDISMRNENCLNISMEDKMKWANSEFNKILKNTIENAAVENICRGTMSRMHNSAKKTHSGLRKDIIVRFFASFHLLTITVRQLVLFVKACGSTHTYTLVHNCLCAFIHIRVEHSGLLIYLTKIYLKWQYFHFRPFKTLSW